MNALTRITLAVAALAAAGQAAAAITFYEKDSFKGRSFTTEQTIINLDRAGFNDRASSMVVNGNRAERWEVCEDRRFRGRCVVLRQGEYPSLQAMGLNDRVSSVRTVGRDDRIADSRYAPAPQAAPPAQAGQVIFFEYDNFQGRSFTADARVADFGREGFNDRASSVVVRGVPWEVCEDARYSGRCVVLRPGPYASLGAMGLNNRISSVRELASPARPEFPRPVPATPPVQASQAVFYEHDNFLGRNFTTESPVDNLGRVGFNNMASSVVVRGALWEVCDNTAYSGRCVVLRPGQYASLGAMGLNDRVSSVREVGGTVRVDESRYGPQPVQSQDYGRRDNERLYQANITSVRAVVDNGGQRCWVEREQVSQERGNPNVPGALLGAVIGGVLGHQVGGGSGRDVATGLGAIAGAAIGANQGRDRGQQATGQDVQRCSTPSAAARPTYWDVTYNFRGIEHQMQMNTQPGSTVQVNEQGEPRV